MTRRTERINRLLQQEISDLLCRHVKDPRLGGLISVTRVSTSADLSQAKVFISIFGDEREKQEVLRTLGAASGFFNRELRGRVTLRHVPDISFSCDETIEKGAHVLQLIKHSECEQQLYPT